MVFEELAVGILNFVNYGITILAILLIIEIARLIGSLGGGKIASAAGSKFGWLGKKLFGKKDDEKVYNLTKKKISPIPKEKKEDAGKGIISLGAGKKPYMAAETAKKGDLVKKSEEELKGLLNLTFGTSRRVWRYNKKVRKRLEDVIEPVPPNKERLHKKLKKVLDIVGKEVNFDALLNDLTTKLTKILKKAPKLSNKLRQLIILNKSIQLSLSKIKPSINSALAEKNVKNVTAHIMVAKLASEKIEKEIPGLQAVIKELEDEL